MKKIFSLLISPKTTLILLLVFSVSIAVATFVEDKYDTTTAQLVIYRAWWFEAIIALMALNFIGNIKRYNLLSRNRIGGLLFHVGFLLLIIGAGVTRYFGFEGSMHIRQGGSSNYILSDEPSLQVSVNGPGGSFSETNKMRINLLGKNKYSFNIKSGNQSTVNVRFKQYLHNAVESVNENVPGGVDMISVQIRDGVFNQGVYLKKGEKINSGKITIAFGDTAATNDIVIKEVDNNLVAFANEEITGLGMADGTAIDSLQSGTKVDFREKRIFSYKGVMFSLIRYYRNAEIVFNEVPDDGHNHGINVMVFDVTYKDQVQRAHLTNVASENGLGQELYFGDTKVFIKYAPQEIPVPFSLKLNKFILERYAGSKSPSSYASEVTVIDTGKNKTFDYRIFMNHVLDYRGYRFFQSSYDQDEKGTILSVNHDFWGTWISYISYLLLLIGFIITLLSKHTRFAVLSLAIRNTRTRRKSITLFIALTGSILAYAQDSGHTVNQQEAEKFGKILVQTYDGRIEPLHTLAFDVMHKISRKDKFSFSGKPEMDPMMVMVDMLADQEYWKRQEMIYVREKSVRQVIGISGKYASFNNFINEKGQYKLAQLIDESFHKSPATQNAFDKELIKVDERANLFYMLLQGNIMKIFPVNMNSTQWVAWNDSLAFQPLRGTITKINDELKLQNFTYNGIMQTYLQALVTGSHSGNYFNADKILGYIKSIQKGNVLSENFPTASKISAEVWYNKVNIFKRLKGYYALLSVFLLFFALVSNFRSQLPKWLSWAQKIFIGLLAATFLFHSFGMALRWYLSGHAPWSDGYEALLLVSWSVVLAGFFFMRNSQIIQAATAFLASIILMTAGHSNYDPQLTNLQPVLKSYWLIVHVAVITISYGFLALGLILGIINMFLYLFKSPHKHVKTDLLINELTYVNEKNLQVGLFLATMGTFLGGVWANESWGRYWGWDAKETWALIIIIVYSIILHLRLVPKLQGAYIFNVGSIIGFGSVLMTFLGVNYFLSKGLHSYASGEKTVFPLWAWIVLLLLAALMIVAGLKERKSKRFSLKGNNHTH